MFSIFKRTNHLRELLDVTAEAARASDQRAETAEARAAQAEERLKSHPLYCSFCNKTQIEVKKLFVGKGPAICNECVFLCVQILCEAQ